MSKIFSTCSVIVLLVGVAYLLAICLLIFISWVTGLPPAHLLPGMNPYSEWKIK